MPAVDIKAKNLRRLLWLLLTISLALWAYLRLHLSLSGPIDILVLIACSPKLLSF
jgi:hypothetical protein